MKLKWILKIEIWLRVDQMELTIQNWKLKVENWNWNLEIKIWIEMRNEKLETKNIKWY